jgi:hypothetical protein
MHPAKISHELNSLIGGRIAALGLAHFAPEIGQAIKAFLGHPLIQGAEHRFDLPFAVFV